MEKTTAIKYKGRKATGTRRSSPCSASMKANSSLSEAHDIWLTVNTTEHPQDKGVQNLQKAYFLHLFNNSPDAIVLVDPDDRIIKVNKGFEKLFGYLDGDIKGRFINNLIVPADRLDEGLASSQTTLRGEPFRTETVRRTKDVRLVDVSLVGCPILFGGKLIGAYVKYNDITERKQFQQNIADSERLYRLVAENVTDVIWKVNLDSATRLNYISPSVANLLGYSVQEAMKKSMQEVFSPASYKNVMSALARKWLV